MALSRKRARELKRLKRSASDLWENQREVLDQASKVVREAGTAAGHLGRHEVAPRVRDTIDHRVKPVFASGALATKAAADGARRKVQHDVLPSVASAVATALAVIEVTKDARVRDAMKAVHKAGGAEKVLDLSSRKTKKKAKKIRKDIAKRVNIVPPKSSGPGRYIVMGVGVVALAGIGYAVWQTLRADDDLWISDEPEEFSAPETL